METKTLTIEHLAPYLPYGLKGTYTLSDVVKLPNGAKDEVREKVLDIENPKFFLTHCKPILRPLSDFNNSEADTEIYETGNHYTSVLLNAATDLPFWEVQILLKHHFDVFGLIDAGLAIDINSIKP